jgi:hypothetical protein
MILLNSKGLGKFRRTGDRDLMAIRYGDSKVHFRARGAAATKPAAPHAIRLGDTCLAGPKDRELSRLSLVGVVF